MRISDWSSDVCSSDAAREGAMAVDDHRLAAGRRDGGGVKMAEPGVGENMDLFERAIVHARRDVGANQHPTRKGCRVGIAPNAEHRRRADAAQRRTEEPRGGKGWVRTWRPRG